MDFSFSEEQRLIRDTVRQFMETEVRPVVREHDRKEEFPHEIVHRLGEMGILGMLVPEEWGGSGADTISYALVLEEISRVSASIGVTVSVNNSVACFPIYKFGSEEQKKKYLPPCARGEWLGAFCLTEPQAGSDAAAIQTRAVRRGDCYLLNGTKSWVTNGGVARIYLVMALTEPGAGSRGISTFVVEDSFPGFRVARFEDKMGLRSSKTAEVVFEDCAVPAANLLGREGQGLKIALASLDAGRVGIAAQSVGIAQGALDEAVRYSKERVAFGKPIKEFQAIQWMLADMATEIEAARALTLRAAFLRDQDVERLGAISSGAKLYASEMANRVVARAVQIHGSAGYSRESDVERMYRDARVTTIYEGTSEIQRLVIARELLGE